MALGLQRLEGERHIVGGERRAVGELRLGPQREGHRHAVRRDLRALGHEPVDGVRLVRRARHQRVEQKLEPLRRVALENVVVEAVEGGHPAPADEREGAALRRVGVRVGEVLEVCGIREIAEGREPVLCFGTRPARARQARERRRAMAATPRARISRVLKASVPPAAWRQAPCRTTTLAVKPGVSAARSSAGRSGSNRRCAPSANTIAARRNRSTTARGRARRWPPPAPPGPWRRSPDRPVCRSPGP